MMPYGWHDGSWGILWMVASWLVIVVLVWVIVRAMIRPEAGGGERQRDPKGDPPGAIRSGRDRRGGVPLPPQRARGRSQSKGAVRVEVDPQRSGGRSSWTTRAGTSRAWNSVRCGTR
jgi:flagellar biosynthesis/type III secretory pathway M-ring protein FliF/YscJ